MDMDPLIPITGYAEDYKSLCNKVAEDGEYYNVLNPKPFATYHKLPRVEIGDTLETTDVQGHYLVKAELESNEHLVEGAVFETGLSAPYTRWKAKYVDYKLQWVEDGKEEKKIKKKFKNVNMLTRSHEQPEEGIFYAVGAESPYKIYGVVSEWEPVGSYISWVADDLKSVKYKAGKSNPGEIAYVKGIYYLYTNDSQWVEIEIPEPVENVYKHVYEKDGEKYKLREGQYFGTLEYYQPRK